VPPNPAIHEGVDGNPQNWIPAPRFHEDRLRGNDKGECPPEADREFEGVPQILPFLLPHEWGIEGVDKRVVRQA
jgi:hypothetical protein